MKAGTGFSNHQDAFESGKRVAEQALYNGHIERSDLVLAFCSGRIDADEFFNGI
jgi:hypothetical protein